MQQTLPDGEFVILSRELDLERAGAQWIQIDEPAVSMRPDEIDHAVETTF